MALRLAAATLPTVDSSGAAPKDGLQLAETEQRHDFCVLLNVSAWAEQPDKRPLTCPNTCKRRTPGGLSTPAPKQPAKKTKVSDATAQGEASYGKPLGSLSHKKQAGASVPETPTKKPGKPPAVSQLGGSASNVVPPLRHPGLLPFPSHFG
ncbi:hypothetical protein SUNI508_10199 [Seiridium unicorne]|uniref:Uncharacterized protein n=1 Tax=Seiridium unicorne TaxID=138068 RepID=A0ABR2UN50_9PEZI